MQTLVSSSRLLPMQPGPGLPRALGTRLSCISGCSHQGRCRAPPPHGQPRSGASESLREGLGGVERALALRLSWVVLAPSSRHPAVPGSPKWLWPHLTASEYYRRCAGGPPGGFVGCMAGGTQRRMAVWSHPTVPFLPPPPVPLPRFRVKLGILFGASSCVTFSGSWSSGRGRA